MLTIRKFLRTLVGRATPIQILLACVLGSLIGFLPVTNGGTAPAMLAVVLLLVLDANVFLAGIVAAGTKLVSIATAPIAFQIGRFALDGPTEPLARRLVNGPVTAWMGFDSYLATGGLVLGLVVGATVGLFVSGSIRRLRRALAGLETSSERFQAVMSRRSVRLLSWIVFGGVPKGGFTELSARRGLPVRWSGTLLALLVIAGAVLAGRLLAGGAARTILAEQLTRINGATVDVDAVEIDWFAGRAAVVGLAACDPEKLDRDFVRADRIGADLDLDALLRRRVAIDLVEATDVRLDQPRATPGRRVASASIPTGTEPEDPVPDAPRPESTEPGNLDEYLRTAGAWKARLEQLQRTIEDLAGRLPEREAPAEETTAPSPADEEAFEAWLRRQVDLHGYAGVRAGHLVEGTPRLLVRRVEALGIRAGGDDERWNMVATSISTEPRLVEEPFELSLRNEVDTAGGRLVLAGLAASGGPNRLEMSVRGLPAPDIVGQLVRAEAPPFRGGTIDARVTGNLRLRPNVRIEAPLEVILRNSTITIGGESAVIPELPVRILVSGDLDDPRITIDEKALAAALEQAGASALAERARTEVDAQIDRGLGNLEKKTGVTIPDDVREGLGGALEGLFGGDRPRR